MPTGDYKTGTYIFYRCDTDEEYHPISPVDIVDACNKLDLDVSEIFNLDSGSIEITFDMKPPDGLTFSDTILVLVGVDEDKIRQNNWRRLHGILMKRRSRR